jgi:hypothetical protein
VSGTPTAGGGGVGENNSFASTPVEVNLNVTVNANGAISVFGEGKPTPTNVIIANKKLPVNSLYYKDSTTEYGLIEIWEPSGAQDDIMAALANSDKTATPGGKNLTDVYKMAAKNLVLGLEALLCDRFDCSGTAPWNESKYAGAPEYTTQRDFGRVALSAYAHSLFGHVDATAAITNDKEFVHQMLSVTAGGDNETDDDKEDGAGAIQRRESYTKTVGDGSVDPLSWLKEASATDANLAIRLVQEIIKKGVTGGVVGGAMIESSVQAAKQAGNVNTKIDSLANIVRQVVGQDPNRLIDADFNQRTKDIRQLLRFYAGDVIYMNITLQVPAVTIGGAYAGPLKDSDSNSSTGIAARFSQTNYTIKITLE